LLDDRLTDGLADGLASMTLARAGRAQKQSVLMAANEGTPEQLEDQTAIHLGIEGEIEVVQGLERIAKGGLLAPAFEQPVGAPAEFIGHQTGDQVPGAPWTRPEPERRRVSSTAAIPPRRNCLGARFNSTRFILSSPRDHGSSNLLRTGTLRCADARRPVRLAVQGDTGWEADDAASARGFEERTLLLLLLQPLLDEIATVHQLAD
jgi:hypothetical protein